MIKVKVLFFANFKEILGCSELVMQIEDGANINTICQQLACKQGVWNDLFQFADNSHCSNKVKVAINQTMAEHSTLIKDGDEIAFFPPVTGG
jgi:sulfur-carrier protein